MITKICPICGTQYQTKRDSKVFCSYECYLVFHKTTFPKMKPCAACGEGFLITRNTPRIYCSKECKAISLRRYRNKREAVGRWRVKRGYIFLAIAYLPPEDQILARQIQDHPNSTIVCAVAEHRLVMAKHLGRPLKKGELVHHINGIKDDNRIENLELTCKMRHANSIVFGNHRIKCPSCGFSSEASEFIVEGKTGH